MKNMDLLWAYQLADNEVEQMEKSIRNTPTRKQLIQLQKFVQASQAKLQELENTAKIDQHKLVELEQQAKRLKEDMEDLNQDIGYYSECNDDELDAKEIGQLIQNCEKTYEAIGNVKKQISKIKQGIAASEELIRTLFAKVKKAKVEYDQLREKYNAEIQADSGDLDALKEKREEAKAKLPETIVNEYQRIKGFRANPVAILKDSRCSGCRLQLPSGVASQVLSSENPVECENCGRILIIQS